MKRTETLNFTLQVITDWDVDVADVLEAHINKLELQRDTFKRAYLLEKQKTETLEQQRDQLKKHNKELQHYNVKLATSEVNLKKELGQLKAQNIRLAKIFNDAPNVDHTFTDVELAEHDAQVVKSNFRRLSLEYLNYPKNLFTGFEVSQHLEAQGNHYANQILQKAQENQ